jgi:2-haloacid dehalogenase
MMAFRPKYITFDCYGTLIDFHMGPMTRTMFADRLAPDRLHAFTTDFSAYRFDEVLGAWKPYADVIKAALRRCCTRWGVPYHDAEAQQLYEAIPTWGPHPDVPAALATVAQEFPLVILSNASDSPDTPQCGKTRCAVSCRVYGRAGAGL